MPNGCLDEDNGILPEFYDKLLTKNKKILKPEFILGYIEAYYRYDDKIELKYISKEKIINFQDEDKDLDR